MKRKECIWLNLDARASKRATHQLLASLLAYPASPKIDEVIRAMLSNAGVIDTTTHDSIGTDWLWGISKPFDVLYWGFVVGMKLGSVRRVNDRCVLLHARHWLEQVTKDRMHRRPKRRRIGVFTKTEPK